MYALLCKRLAEEAPNFEPPHNPPTFRLLLLNKCRKEFEERAAALEANSYQSTAGQDAQDDEDDRRQFAKRKMLGNIKFIGELGKLGILSEGILHRCIHELLVRRGDDPSEDLECLCQIMRTCGRNLDTPKGKCLMEQYFNRMKLLTNNTDLPPRIRFMLKDVIDLREDRWVPRKAAIVEGPVPINQIRIDDDERPSAFRRGGGGGGNMAGSGGGGGTGERNMVYDRDGDRSNLTDIFRHPMKTRGGLDDMLMNINLAPTTQNLIPTNPFGPNGFGGGQRDGGYRSHGNQRGGGYNNYNNQRGQYKHNQNNANSQFNSQSNKEIAPRFKKNLIVGMDEIGNVQLRPTSMLFDKASVKTNNLMNSRNNTTEPTYPSQPVKQTPPPLLKEPLPIKQASADKPKHSKKDKGPTKDEVIKKYTSLLEDYCKGELDIKQAVNTYKEHKVPDKFAKDVILQGLSLALDKSDVEQEKIIKLLSALKEENAVNTSNLQDAFKSLSNILDERENESEKVTKSSALLYAEAIIEHLITLGEVASFTENGAYHPLFILVLQRLHQKQGTTTLTETFNKCKINLLNQLPENDKTKERLSEILDEYELTFLYPLLRIQAELAKQLAADPNPQSYYKWLKDNYDNSNFSDPGFINALVTVLLKYVTEKASNNETTNGEDEKASGEKEKCMLEPYQDILKSFLHENVSLQVIAVYSLQAHFYTLGFPRGQLVRWFIAFYNLDIVDEEAFLTWKEDLSDTYPGKGQALFQVHSWLDWLQNAESEEEEGDD